MKIEKHNLFATLKSPEQIIELIQTLPQKEQHTGHLIMMLTWNYLIGQFEQDKE